MSRGGRALLLLVAWVLMGADALDPRRLEVAGFPVVAYNSDTGLGLGLLGTVARFAPPPPPHRWRLDVLAVVSVREQPGGAVEASRQLYALDLDLPRTPAPGLRLLTRAELLRLKVAGYYGLGNASPDLADRPERAHQYEHLAPRLEVALRRRTWGDLEIVGGLAASYHVVGIYPGSQLDTDRAALRGLEDHELAELRGGLRWDTRDHEIVPTRGMFHEVSWRAAGSASAGLVYGGANATLRFFLPLAPPYLVFASRLVGDVLVGDPPFYELGFLGGALALRGIPIGRFAGETRALANLELRSRFWRLVVLGQRLHVGGVAFCDLGRVVAGITPDPTLDGRGLGLKSSQGGGLRVQWGESFVARVDAAWSPDAEAPGIYAGASHIF